jgi:hypothetical protein
MPSSLLVPRSIYGPRSPDAAFVLRLKAFDASLVVYFNPHKGRWVIDRCIHGAECSHSGHCERVNAMVVETPEKGYMPLGDRVFEELRKRDMWRYSSPEQIQVLQDNERDEQNAKIEKSIRDDWNSAIREDRPQLNKLRTILQTHDLRLNK